MKNVKFDKLVRDKLPEVLKNDPAVESFVIEEPHPKRTYARDKLIEEAGEAAVCYDRCDLIVELADLLEVMLKVAQENNIKADEILIAMGEKQRTHGKFDKNIILKEITYK